MKLDEQQIKEQMCEVCRRMWQLGWTAGNDGNITVKLEDGSILTTPAGICKGLVTVDKIVRTDSSGNITEANGDYRPSSELKMHLRCYQERPDINAVVHAHPPIATGFSAAHKAIDGYSTIEAVLIFGSVPVAPYATPSTSEVSDSIAPYLSEHDGLLLSNHGALTVGSDLQTAYCRMETLEQLAKISLVANLLGGEKEIGKSNIEKILSIRKNYHISGKHPGYKKYPLGSK